MLVFAWFIYVSATYFSNSEVESFSLFALLGVLAMAVQKLLPIVQQAYSGWARLAGASDIIEDTLIRLEGYERKQLIPKSQPSKLSFNNKIVLDDQGPDSPTST